MHIKVIQYSSNNNPDWIKNRVAAVIDVFRATSVIVTALAHGAKSVVVASEIEETIALSKQYASGQYILGGERKLNPISGFHYGNSPELYTSDFIRNKHVILTTTNGTKAIKSCRIAKAVYACALLNCSALAGELAKQPDNITIICSGSKQEFALEDAFCAGMLIAEIEKHAPIEVCDFSMALKNIYLNNKSNAKRFLEKSKAYQALKIYGYEKDIDFCLQNNIHFAVPRLINTEFVTN